MLVAQRTCCSRQIAERLFWGHQIHQMDDHGHVERDDDDDDDEDED